MDTENKILGLMAVTLIVLIVGTLASFYPQFRITGAQTYTQTAESQAVIEYYIAISRSTNLSSGIDFGTIVVLPTTNQNATANYNGSGNTTYWISVSTDSNTPVDLCIKSDKFNTSGGDEILLGNYTWDDDTSNNVDAPNTTSGTAITESYAKGSTSITAGNRDNYRFWLSVPAGQAAGTYNSTVTFKAIKAGDPCGT